MPSARYWRLHQPTPTDVTSQLQFTEIALYDGATRVDQSATITSTGSPASGTLAALSDGSSATVVAFAASTWAAMGFSIAWDMGSAVNVDEIRVSGSSDQSTSVYDFILQSSSDGIAWDGELYATGVAHSNPGGTTNITIAQADAYAAQTVLRLKGAGAEGNQSFVDQSTAETALTTLGDVKNTLADKLVRGPCIALDGANDGLRIGSDANFNFGTGDYTIELFHKTKAYTNGYAAFLASGSTTWSTNNRVFRMHDGSSAIGSPRSIALVSYEPPTYPVFSPTLVDLDRWTHYALTRSGNVLRLFLDGVIVATSAAYTLSDNLNMGGFTYVFYSDFDKQSLNGYVDEFRVTKGVARYTVSDATIPLKAAYTGRYHQGERVRGVVTNPGAKDVTLFTNPSANVSPVLKVPTLPRIDVIFGGNGVINGTVKERSLPENAPLARRVRLIEQRSGYVVAEAWSNATTGAYSFANIDRSRKYTVVSYDHTGFYRAVIADNLTPDLMT